ncbi:hypothetical protein SAMN04488120_106144 [Fontimonas thermophila]|uniref:Uncharacterized protein n=1 Tax=Fontimonas thermophila TaxID=1076937 RepID=A0A1I2JCP0_9GAMM|nr:DUF6763 family protein [Fontimonas thermophila]SFF51750.1 hypothetical protein SAMN04488120_106144 [Fontimonas thermophila]
MAEWLSDLAIGQWFKTDGEPFEIVGIDPKAEIVLVQHFDGTLEEFDFDTWTQLLAQPCAPPEDYSGALDIDREDYLDYRDDLVPRPGRWDNPLDLIDLHNR